MTDLGELLIDLKIVGLAPRLDCMTGALNLSRPAALREMCESSEPVRRQVEALVEKCKTLRVELRHHLAPKCRACGRPFWCREDRERVVGANPFCQRVPCPQRHPVEDYE
jgi:hypothetical protein